MIVLKTPAVNGRQTRNSKRKRDQRGNRAAGTWRSPAPTCVPRRQLSERPRVQNSLIKIKILYCIREADCEIAVLQDPIATERGDRSARVPTGTTRFARPIWCASRAATGRPVRMRSSARPSPTTRGRRPGAHVHKRHTCVSTFMLTSCYSVITIISYTV